VVSFQARRFDLAVLRALGAGGGWVSRAVHWQATVLVVVPALIGVPVGLVAGAVLFRTVVGRLGLVPDPTYPLLVVGLAVAAGVVAANLVAVLPAIRARHLRTVTQLRPE
jgi:predicted lysophospholipase L1 biosynthesis ABC-type transport system permease subunit